MSTIPEIAQLAIAHARRGELGQALELAKQALSVRPKDHGLMLFVGMLHERQMNLDEALHSFQAAFRLKPSDPITRLELARILIALNQLDEAERLLTSRPLPGREPKRLTGLIALRRGRAVEATQLFDAIVKQDPRDFESWGNLGVARLATGDAPGAIDALRSSLHLRRDQQRIRDKWAEAHMLAGTGEQGLELARAYAIRHPDDILSRLSAARLMDLLGQPDEALAAIEEALRIQPDHAAGLIALAQLQERQNNIDAFASATARLEAAHPRAPELPLLQARLALRQGDLDRALQLANEVPPILDEGDRNHLLGQIYDRKGDAGRAFEAFSKMNSAGAVAPDVISARARAYRTLIGRRSQLVTRKWVRSWRKWRPDEQQRDPVFLVGFPRSGTTLLDTLLMGHPQVCVTEEKPMLSVVAQKLGDYGRLATLSGEELSELRQLYFTQAAAHVPDLDGRLLIDKQPFAMAEAPLIYRLFPNAKLLFVQRHPCDVVLSCFITRFEPNAALANFVTLQSTAQLYGELRKFWSQCRSILPMIVQLVRYERLVDDAEMEMRALIAFLGLEWTDALLDHRIPAKDRGFINTPSYSQVIEPLYDRSIGRWERYREQMKPILPVLEPWAKRMGYEV